MQERLQQFRQTVRLSELMTAENHRQRTRSNRWPTRAEAVEGQGLDFRSRYAPAVKPGKRRNSMPSLGFLGRQTSAVQ
jgi:hypothetical protein